MNKLSIAIMLCALFVNPFLTQAETLSKSSFQLKEPGIEVVVEKFLYEQGVSVKITSAEGKSLLESDSLGSEEKVFTISGNVTSLATHDFDGDGNLEVIAAAYYGPKASALHVFRYDKASEKFGPVKFFNDSDPDLSTDFIASDIRQKNGQDLVVNEDGSIVALGMIYPADAESKAVAGLFTYRMSGGQFRLVDKQSLR